MHLTHLACTLCGQHHDATVPQNVSACCGKPLFAHYDLAAAARTLTKGALRSRAKSLWRYREVLPVRDDSNIVTLGEGWTPLLPAPRLGAKHGMNKLFIKDEAQNPTASFKARGMTAAVSMARQFGLKKLAVPSGGNAAAALAQPVPLPFTPDQVTAKWTFGGKWDPENKTDPTVKKISTDKNQLTVTFGESVTVKGHPRLALRNGAFADCTSGSGTDTLIFTAPLALSLSNRPQTPPPRNSISTAAPSSPPKLRRRCASPPPRCPDSRRGAVLLRPSQERDKLPPLHLPPARLTPAPPRKESAFMGRIRRGGFIITWFIGDHDPRHVHIETTGGKLVGRLDLRTRKGLEGWQPGKKLLRVIAELEKEGRL